MPRKAESAALRSMTGDGLRLSIASHMKMGLYDLEIEAPDLLVIRLRGPVDLSACEVIGRAVAEVSRDGKAFILTHIEGADIDMSPEARRHFIEMTRGMSTIVDAVVGANFRTRVIGRLVDGAARVLSRMRVRVDFHDDEASARAWLRGHGCVACGAKA